MKPRRSRLRRLLKWTGTAACGLILLAAAFCLRWEYAYLYQGDNSSLGVAGGGVGILWTGYKIQGKLLLSGPKYDSWQPAIRDWITYGCWPRAKAYPGAWFLSVPLWIPFLLFSFPTAWLWWRDRRRIGPGCCPACGYNLTGNVSGRCPECGAAAAVESPSGPSE